MARGPESDGEEQIRERRRLRFPEEQRARVGEVLRRAYDDALAEPVPAAFADLLRRLE